MEQPDPDLDLGPNIEHDTPPDDLEDERPDIGPDWPDDTVMGNVTWHDVINAVNHGLGNAPLDDDTATWLLWEETPFPMGSFTDILTAIVATLDKARS